MTMEPDMLKTSTHFVQNNVYYNRFYLNANLLALRLLRISVNTIKRNSNGSHVRLDRLRPVLHVAQFLQRATKRLDQPHPLLGLLGKVACACVQLFRFSVQLLLVKIRLSHTESNYYGNWPEALESG